MDNEKIELQVLDISSSPSHPGMYELLLGEAGGGRRLPILVGASEAQVLMLQLKGLAPARPMTHHLFASVLEVLGVKLMRVVIYQVVNGVFYSYLYMRTDSSVLRVDSRTSDAVALALRMEAPIFAYPKVLEAGYTENAGNAAQAAGHGYPPANGGDGLEERKLHILQADLQRAVEEENYERAAQLRDLINQYKKT